MASLKRASHSGRTSTRLGTSPALKKTSATCCCDPIAWGVTGRPDWIKLARTYPLVNASADALVQMIEAHHEEIEAKDRTVHIRGE